MSLSQETQALSESLGKSSSPALSIGRMSQVDKENEQERGTSINTSGTDAVDDLLMDPDDSLMDSFLSSHSREFSDFISHDIVDSPGGHSSVSQAISDSDFRVKKTLDATAADIRLLAGMSKTPDPARQSKHGGSAQEGPLSAPMARRAPEYMSPRQRAKLIESPLANNSGVQSSPLRAHSVQKQAPRKAQLISSASSSFIAARSIFESQPQSQSTKEARPKSPVVPHSPELGVQYSVGPMTEDFEFIQAKYDSDNSQEMYGTSPQRSKAQLKRKQSLSLSYSSSESDYPNADDFLAARSTPSTSKPLNLPDKGRKLENQNQNDKGTSSEPSSNVDAAKGNDNIDNGPENESSILKQQVEMQRPGKRRRTHDSDSGYGNEAVPVLPSDNSNEDTESLAKSENISFAYGLSSNGWTSGVPMAKTSASRRHRLKVIPWSSPKRIKLSSEPAYLRRSLDKGHASLGSLTSGSPGKQNGHQTLVARRILKTQSLLTNSTIHAQVEPLAGDADHDQITPTAVVSFDNPRSNAEAGADADAGVDIDGTSSGQGEDLDHANGGFASRSSDDTLPGTGDSSRKEINDQKSPHVASKTGAPGRAKVVNSKFAADDSDSSEPESVELEPEDITPKSSKTVDSKVYSPRVASRGLSNEQPNEKPSEGDESDKETDKVPSDESDTEDKGEEVIANDSNSDIESWHPAERALGDSDEWRPESSEIPNVPQPKKAATPSPLKPVELPLAPATATKIKLPVSMLASTVKRNTKKITVPKTQPVPNRQRRLSSSRPVSICQRLIQLHELTKDNSDMDNVQSGLLSLLDSSHPSKHPSTKQSVPPSPVRSTTFSGTMRVFGEGAPELSDSDRLNYMRKVKGLIDGTAMTAKEALRVLYFFTGDWVGARKYIIAGCVQPAASSSCMWTAKDDEVLLQGMSSSTVESLRQSKGNMEVYRRLQFLNTFHGAKN
ncbi:hypothetical protein IW140_000677 [Coemansia sp. RSA 1813]|nr:hypothetical protein EV178_000818 [Coemansia sp. RSA 1646]KAJ1773856.1 hypothetical protein LPJ74_000400 [Coemansia sp. RSA 1843]KAJ2092438.1 hypothetical protein IW138_001200 [Coemansia sp. RSA 986]KAJ2217338.1 hypothetical protein EV179_000488 [Coemansia sp. RSA 487]KAJ2572562.1 hypothetical protein IW140_000677 [Coemansia sp. RSA 1813]